MTLSFATQTEADRIHDQIDEECRRLGLSPMRSRADMLDIPAIAKLGSDSCGLPLAFHNTYSCDECGVEWEDEWSCEVDDDCPCCGSAITPSRSDRLIPNLYARLFELLPEVQW